MALPSTWSICCFMEQTRLLKMPQGTVHFTFLPCTTRQVWKQTVYDTFITIIIMLFFINTLISLNEQESCVRVLLYRGANKEAKNNHGQTPFQVNGLTII